MKRKYMKPAMRVVLLQHRHSLLVGSPGGYNNTSVGIMDDEVTDENSVW